jgi:hypothetical protein
VPLDAGSFVCAGDAGGLYTIWTAQRFAPVNNNERCGGQQRRQQQRQHGRSVNQHALPPAARNPFFPKYFLSVGDWTCRVWNEDQRSPLLVSRYSPAYLSGGTWSPTRPGVFFTTQNNGTLSCWDLFYKHNEPSLQVNTPGDVCVLTPAATCQPDRLPAEAGGRRQVSAVPRRHTRHGCHGCI